MMGFNHFLCISRDFKNPLIPLFYKTQPSNSIRGVKMDLPKTVIKRDGREVPFDVERIKVSIKKAMYAKNKYDPNSLSDVVNEVISSVEHIFDGTRTPTVEEIQDIIEVSLMRKGLFDVAKTYILYREKKREIREEKMKILNKDHLDEVDKKFPVNSLRLLAARYLIKDENGLPVESPKQLFQRVSVAMALPEVFYDPSVYSKVPVNVIPVDEGLKDVDSFNYEEMDGVYKLNGWPINKYHFERMQNLYRELLHKGKVKKKFSDILEMLKLGEFKKAAYVAQRAYDLMVNRDFMPNTPTLVNAGRRLGMLSACFTLDVEDDMESIMKLAHDCALVHKSGGGTGMNFSKIRPHGDIVASTTGVASGPISFMKMVDAVSDVIKQGGVRRAANMGILEVWHPDIEEFITSKQKEGVLENFNISVGITADFWDYLDSGEDYPLVNPRTGKVYSKVDPKQLFDLIAYNAWATADPGVLFFDVINRRNVLKPYKGEIHVTNPCGEEPLYPYESCNLASINVEHFIDEKTGEIDWERFNATAKFVARLLDNIISINKYPLPEIDRETKKTRRIGLGLMGVANALFKLKIRYNSEKGFKKMSEIAEHLTYYAYESSIELAKERGTFPVYDQTDYKKGELPIEGYYNEKDWTVDWNTLVSKIKEYGLRNAMVTTAPPTGSVGMIADTSTGVEPVFSLAFEKRVSVGSFYYTNDIFEEELKKRGIYSTELINKIVENYGSAQGIDEIPEDIREIFVTAMDIHWADHIMAQAVMQKWITDSISKTINMPADATVEDVGQAYLIAHELGCKGTTIYRDGSKSGQVLNVTSENKIKRFKAEVSGYTKNKLIEIASRRKYLSRYLDILKEFGEDVPQVEDGKESKDAPSTTERTLQVLQVSMAATTPKSMGEEGLAPVVKGPAIQEVGDVCPACGASAVIHESGCATCKVCGWSACSVS